MFINIMYGPCVSMKANGQGNLLKKLLMKFEEKTKFETTSLCQSVFGMCTMLTIPDCLSKSCSYKHLSNSLNPYSR